jgi:uncharacterized protein YegL
MAQNDDAKISALNNAVRECLPVLRDAAADNSVQVLVRALAFSTGFRWHIRAPTPVDEVRWDNLTAGGRTDLGAALRELANEMHALERDSTSGSFVPPAIVLVSDGHPTDEYGAGLKALLETSWGQKSARIAIGVGDDADHQTLTRFMGNDEMPVLGANEPDALVTLLKWASTVAVGRASSPPKTTAVTAPPPLPSDAPGDRIFTIAKGGGSTSPPAAAGPNSTAPPAGPRRIIGRKQP